MYHSIEVTVYILNNPEAIEYDEVPLEVLFEMDGNRSIITGYMMDGKDLSFTQYSLLKENNPSLDQRIDRAIDHYITNYEEEYQDENR